VAKHITNLSSIHLFGQVPELQATTTFETDEELMTALEVAVRDHPGECLQYARLLLARASFAREEEKGVSQAIPFKKKMPGAWNPEQ